MGRITYYVIAFAHTTVCPSVNILIPDNLPDDINFRMLATILIKHWYPHSRLQFVDSKFSVYLIRLC